VIAGLILAAGRSSRMGRPKLLLDLGGRPVIGHVLGTALAAPLEEIVVVLGEEPDAIERACGRTIAAVGGGRRGAGSSPSVRFVRNERFAEGQSTSLLAGIGSLDEPIDAAVVLLGDQPGIRSDAIEAVIAGSRAAGAHIVQAAYSGVPAHPTLFARAAWPALAALTGDEGARRLIEARPEWRTLVEVGGDPPLDVDTPEDLERLRARFEPNLPQADL